VTADGTERRVSLTALAGVQLEDGRPVRSFPSYRGQRNYPGWYWTIDEAAAAPNGYLRAVPGGRRGSAERAQVLSRRASASIVVVSWSVSCTCQPAHAAASALLPRASRAWLERAEHSVGVCRLQSARWPGYRARRLPLCVGLVSARAARSVGRNDRAVITVRPYGAA